MRQKKSPHFCEPFLCFLLRYHTDGFLSSKRNSSVMSRVNVAFASRSTLTGTPNFWNFFWDAMYSVAQSTYFRVCSRTSLSTSSFLTPVYRTYSRWIKSKVFVSLFSVARSIRIGRMWQTYGAGSFLTVFSLISSKIAGIST